MSRSRDIASGTFSGTVTATDFSGDGSSLTGISSVWNIVSSGSASSATYLEISIPSTYDSYILKLNNFQPTGADAILFAQVSTDNGSTYLTGASDYQQLSTSFSYGVLTISNSKQVSTGTLSTTSFDGLVQILNTQNTNFHTYFIPECTYPNANYTDSGLGTFKYSTRAETTSVVNRIRLGYTDSATLTGNYILYGISED